MPNLASFSSSIHLTVQDISVDGAFSPSCMRVTIKTSKTDPFRKGADLYIGLGSQSLCAVQAMVAYLFFLSSVLLTDWLRQIFSAVGIRELLQPQFPHRRRNGRRL